MYDLNVPRRTGYPLRIVRFAFLAFLFMVNAPTATTKTDGDRSLPERVANSGPTTVLMFDMRAGGTYLVKKNGVDMTTVDVGPWGVLTFNDVTLATDEFQITWTGDNPVDPSTPTGLTASGTDVGCAELSWNEPGADEYVYEYMLAWGPSAGVYTDSTTVSVTQISSQGGTSSFSHCGLPDGHYCFTIRAHNLFDRWSAYGSPSCTDVTNGSTQGPPAPRNIAVVETEYGCASVSWDAVGDPAVTGYVVYYGDASVAGGQAGAYDDSLDVGSDTDAEVCGFTAGTYYFAVKSYTGGGVKSSYSSESPLVMEGVDEAPPEVTSMTPADGATGVALNIPVSFTISDDKTGVDRNSLTLTVDGTIVTQTQIEIFGDPSRYVVVATLPGDFPANSTVDVGVTVSDLASPPNERVVSWSFETGEGAIIDTAPPTFSGMDPPNGAVDVPEDAAVRVNLSDGGMGVDVSGIEFYVDDQQVNYTVEGTPSDLTVVYENTDGFAPGAEVSIRVRACDMANPANCAELTDYTFTVETVVANAPPEGAGAIVPDGFWANDPIRPLEVRDLPVSWTVRIFDTAGRRVRDYTNNAADGQIWMWDFTNDQGQRVARAMYLVRVTDPDGKVRQSGRFLVQTDP